MPDDFSVATEMDPSADTGAVEPEEIESTDGAEDASVEGSEGESQEAEGESSEQSDTSDDGKALPSDLRKLIKDIRERDKSPAASKLVAKLRNLYFADRTLRAEFPNGVREVREFRQKMEEVGGPQALAEMAQERAAWEKLDEQFSSGDPEFVRSIASESPDAFIAMVPTILQQAAQVNPEFHAALVRNIVASTLDNVGLPNHLYLLNEMMAMKNYDRAAQLVQELAQWTKQTLESGRKPPEVKRPEVKGPDEREQKLAEREQKLFKEEVGRRYANFCAPLVKSEFAKYSGGKNLTPAMAEKVDQEILKEISTRADSDPSFKTAFDRYYAARDTDGLMKLAQAKFRQLLPDAARRVHGRLFRNVTPAKKQTSQQQNTAAGAKGGSSSWQRVSQEPSNAAIDWSRTNRNMVWSDSAVLKDGRRVYWGANAPS